MIEINYAELHCIMILYKLRIYQHKFQKFWCNLHKDKYQPGPYEHEHTDDSHLMDYRLQCCCISMLTTAFVAIPYGNVPNGIFRLARCPANGVNLIVDAFRCVCVFGFSSERYIWMRCKWINVLCQRANAFGRSIDPMTTTSAGYNQFRLPLPSVDSVKKNISFLFPHRQIRANGKSDKKSQPAVAAMNQSTQTTHNKNT